MAREKALLCLSSVKTIGGLSICVQTTGFTFVGAIIDSHRVQFHDSYIFVACLLSKFAFVLPLINSTSEETNPFPYFPNT